jgi:hypothetical protein
MRKTRRRSEHQPVLFLDVDGVISLFGFEPGDPPGRMHSIEGIPHCIGHGAAAHLARLAGRYELVWATGWEEKANEHLVSVLELPGDLPSLSFDGRAVFGSSHWKLEAMEEYAGQRPVAWIDDNLDGRCRTWARRRAAPTLLVETERGTGITAAHVDVLLRWADEVGAEHSR